MVAENANESLTALRQQILLYDGLDSKSEAVKFALKTIDDVQKERVHMADKDVPRQPEREKTNGISEITIDNGKLEEVKVRKTNKDKVEKKNFGVLSFVFAFLRFLIAELPLVVLMSFAVAAHVGEYVYRVYLDPQIDLMEYTDHNKTVDRTYYQMNCDASDISTLDPQDLYIQSHFTTKDSVDHMLTHGMSVYKNILKKDTASKLREWILERNKSLNKGDEIDVIANENRWSFYIGANEDPIVTEAIKEVANHKIFLPAVEKIVGTNPAIIEMTAITSAYGAEDQFWHHDIVAEGSPAKYGRSFIPSYSLFMNLQDTTAAMGATEVCPGTYRCTNSDSDRTCREDGFQVSGDGVWEQGDAVFMNQQSFHRGAAHTDPNGPHRVLFIITFAPRPMDIKYETRLVGQGGSYSLKWDMWGHTLNDFRSSESRMVQPWTTLRSLGVYKPKEYQWGWDWITQQSMRLANGDIGYADESQFQAMVDNIRGFLPNIFNVEISRGMGYKEYFQSMTERFKDVLTKIALWASGVYVVISLFLSLLLHVVLSRNKHFGSPIKGAMRSIWRVAMLDAVVVCIGYLLICRTDNSDWAKAIRSKTLYSSAFLSVPQIIEEKPFAVLSRKDMLISDRLDFKNLGSLSDMLDFHGGNVMFRSIISGGSKIVQNLTPEEVEMLVEDVVDGLRREGTRLLLQNHNADWVELSVEDAKAYTKQYLFLETNNAVKAIHRESRYLESSFKYGLKYKGAMAQRYGPALVKNLTKSILDNAGVPYFDPYPLSGNSLNNPKSSSSAMKKEMPKPFGKPRFTLLYPHRSISLQRTTSSIPKKIQVGKGGMLKVGDIVEAKYQGAFNEFYKGQIVSVQEGSIVDVLYSDGEIDKGLDQSHVKAFVPYYEGESVEVKRSTDGAFLPAVVTGIISETAIYVRMNDNNKRRRVDHSNVRRVKQFKVGDPVFAPFNNSGEFFPAKIVKENADGTVNLLFDDGDKENNVEKRVLEAIEYI
ncbi:hypothetical protein CTEN210_04672 [Chaetoceros tenuissimus]|uniref:Tudor domain-containing protein n=1 Tax=Chaetoceros tenuissimus TaxID=426638 RepID=A0AAD3H2S9_9STRA|nr:hypothetical protein CTEN210_04672 [Chaetoceros tenuissimus]